jgi:hypothetical protein
MDRLHQLNLLATGRFHLWLNSGVRGSLLSGVPSYVTIGSDDNRGGLIFDRAPRLARNTGRGLGLAGVDLRWSREFRHWAPTGPALTIPRMQ